MRRFSCLLEVQLADLPCVEDVPDLILDASCDEILQDTLLNLVSTHCLPCQQLAVLAAMPDPALQERCEIKKAKKDWMRYALYV